MKVKLTKKNLKILEKGFKRAPKTYEEALEAGKLEPIAQGIKYKDFEKESYLLKKILNKHEKDLCSCSLKQPCYYARYLNKEITVENIITEIQSNKS
jgi:hypothetical protein